MLLNFIRVISPTDVHVKPSHLFVPTAALIYAALHQRRQDGALATGTRNGLRGNEYEMSGARLG
ncbi:hypothetical protein E2C01_028445 [Portunus trituberculatus]|uniref:Uncharacterized protein n=1 Tax=Portunus trituberculatus TaxID=210409 RepID=A0A5B7EP52_PORTR|nr:hypothetical protein [Portunus trituberculatus]